VLVAYGGAGPTHAVFYGHDIGSKAILVPADSTVFSAEGMLTCDITHLFEGSRHMVTPFSDDDLATITTRFQELEGRALEQFAAEGVGADEIQLARTLHVRFGQQIHGVEVEVDPGEVTREAIDRVLERFVERYAQVYGRGALVMGASHEIELHRVVGTRHVEPIPYVAHEDAGPDASAALKGEREAYFEPLGYTSTRVYDGEALKAGNLIEGPAIIERMGDSVVVPIGFEATVDPYLSLRLNAAADVVGAGATTATQMDVTR
jgi:N-methylhydantoinase A